MSILDIFRKRKKQEPQQKQQEIVTQQPKPEERYILCIDGGGMRGIIPVVYLQELERKIREKGGKKPLPEYFDLVAGTSTGGLISISLTCPSSLSNDLESLAGTYRVMGKTIFPASPIPGLRQIATAKYPSNGIESLLSRWFADSTLGQASVPTLIMAYNITTGCAEPLRSYVESSFPVKSAGRATSAAPTYFAPLSTDKGLLVDGGVIANNPSLYAYFEAKKLYPDCKKFHILSLSTGAKCHTMKPNDTYGLLSWADNVSPMYSTAQKGTCDYFCRNTQDIDYIRIDKPLEQSVRMDETNPEVIGKMETFAKEAVKDYDGVLDELACKLVENTDRENR